ncbi:MAG: pyruvate dehydrogenase (acetyl-transferring), homodimeric type, partial [Gammaproteobacteria bacterium]|nr:pyruvate dehydrogenase (acetyl-transferring), homodimeric type [Gammaproteobacteria bacterium]
MSEMSDKDPQETQEWLEALESVIEFEGSDRAHYLIEKMIDRARRSGANLPYSSNTAYVNTIPVAQQKRIPGDQSLEHKLRAYIRWNAMAIVVKANHRPGNVGGHIASFASSATLYDVGFNHFFQGNDAEKGGDLVFFQGHIAPGVYSRAYLEGRITREQLEN